LDFDWRRAGGKRDCNGRFWLGYRELGVSDMRRKAARERQRYD
jgi:hypothetical protein